MNGFHDWEDDDTYSQVKKDSNVQPAHVSQHSSNEMLSAAFVNHNELMLPINFRALAEEHGVRKGTIYYSDTFKSWVIQGHPEIDLICIDAPFVKGRIMKGLKGKASRFNGKEIQNVIIRSNTWCAVF